MRLACSSALPGAADGVVIEFCERLRMHTYVGYGNTGVGPVA